MSYSTDTLQVELLSLKRIDERQYCFNIPPYQRPYVWSSEDILTLFNDVYDAYKKDKVSHYFMGTTLTCINMVNDRKVYELIDGQQRITSLMLICMALGAENTENIDKKIIEFPIYNKEPRLQFAIRENVQQFFKDFYGNYELLAKREQQLLKDNYLECIIIALKALQGRIKAVKKETHLAELANYFYQNLYWVNNIVPTTMDINRLFTTMNTAGIQLSNTDLLKAKLLEKIKSKKALYEAIWNACEHMDNYIERNLKKLKLGEVGVIENGLIAPSNIEIIEQLFEYPSDTDTKALTSSSTEDLTIDHIVYEAFDNTQEIESNKKQSDSSSSDEWDDEQNEALPESNRAIISFPLLLIHTLRIFYIEQGWSEKDNLTYHTKNLLNIFDDFIKNEDRAIYENTIKTFFTKLLQVRIVFDRWVVRWVEKQGEQGEFLALTSLVLRENQGKNKDKIYHQRTIQPVDALAMLQAVRYFTSERNSQFWLTPYLYRAMQDSKECSNESLLDKLEEIDNKLSVPLYSITKNQEANSTQTQQSISFALAKNEHIALEPWQAVESYLNADHGTGFRHYWFQKLEYVLWKKYKRENTENVEDLASNNDKNEELSKYRITSKNSIEHVFPQTPEIGDPLDDKKLNAFGNLALLNISQNSSYGNKPFLEKKILFNKREAIDSLKLWKIFKNDSWDTDQIEKHQEEMIQLLKWHYQSKCSADK